MDKTKIKVITHDKFIPKEYLPTFNSCTIEMFLWNIPGLSENFLYANDDFFVVNPTKAEDYFEHGKYKFKLQKQSSAGSMYLHQCRHGSELIYGKQADGLYTRIDHEFRPYSRKLMKECFELHKSEILDSITQFRDMKNFNCFIYALYLDKIGKVERSTLLTGYLSAPTWWKCEEMLEKYHTICVNDSSVHNIYDNSEVLDAFYRSLDKQSKYELTKFIRHPKAKHLKNRTYLYF